MAELDLETIRHALSVARQSGLAEVQLESGDAAFSAVLNGTAAKSTPAVHAVADLDAATNLPIVDGKPITSPCVGFYKPLDSVFVLGKRVEKGQIVATIQALGLANDVESPVAGEIQEIFVTPDQPVEFGQPLALVRES